ncbi:MAG: DMT family transporter [Bacillota bacterium]|nr:DMT family transporter [Bacillota bacterium]MDP4169974.1 DMT family transporter [Bacillota bacterium]
MEKWKGVTLVVISAICFGLMSTLARLARSFGVNLLTMLSIRFLIAFCILVVIGFATKKNFRISIKDFFVLTLMGIFGYAVMAFLLFSSYHYLPVSIATIIFYMYPLLTYILSILLKYEIFKVKKAIIYAICIIGLVTSIYSGGEIAPLGIVFAISAAAIYSIFIIISDTLIKDIPSFVSTTIICLTAGLTLLIVGLLKHEVSVNLSLNGWGIILVFAIVSTVVPIVFFFNGVKIIGAANAALLSTIEPVTAILLSVVLFHDVLNWIQQLGIIVVLAATMLSQYKSRVADHSYMEKISA